MNIPTKTLERQLLAEGYDRVIGIDEVGMACLAGPVVVCALSVDPDFYNHSHQKLAGLRDSKLLSVSQREYFVDILKNEPGIYWKISSCEPKVIDEINIYQASRLAMRTAIAGLGVETHSIVLVDGNKLIPELSLPQRAIVKGDRKIWAIAAASVLAKVYRDTLMTRYSEQYPGYGFEQHKGYPTKMHFERIRKLGQCPLHRKSFRSYSL